jgi:hypothetical protein
LGYRIRSDRLDADLQTELQYHLAETVGRLIEDGMPGQAALHEAQRRLANYAAHKERTRDMDITSGWIRLVPMSCIPSPIERLNPGFTAVAVLSLALGIGANTAIFSACRCDPVHMLLVKNPDELVSIELQKGSAGGSGGPVALQLRPMRNGSSSAGNSRRAGVECSQI